MMLIKSEWRTTDVMLLCQGMRETQDYSALPILADALEEAGCDDNSFLEGLRSSQEPVVAQRLVCIIYSEETAKAVRWLEQWVRDTNYHSYSVDEDDNEIPGTRRESDTDPHTYETIVQEVTNAIDTGETLCFGTDDAVEVLYDEHKRQEFLSKWALIVNRLPPETENFHFRCAC